MKAIRLSDGRLHLCDAVDLPRPPEGSVLVRVTQAGICETDLQLVAGYMGFSGTLGHEFVGLAESGRFQGKRVVGEINCVCKKCDYCCGGLGNHCPFRTVIGILNHDGAFAEYLVVPEENLHLVPDSLTDDLATLVEPVAAALQIGEQVDLSRVETSYVVGDGRLGNLCAQALRSAGCRVIVVGKHPEKLERFSGIGFDTYLLDEVRQFDGAKHVLADLVVDCAGTESGLETAISLVRPRGTVVMKTTVARPHSLPMAKIVIDEVTLLGSRCGPFDKAIQGLSSGDFQLEDFVTATYPLDDFEKAFEHATRKDALKVILQIAEN